jgi:hypothetical protein
MRVLGAAALVLLVGACSSARRADPTPTTGAPTTTRIVPAAPSTSTAPTTSTTMRPVPGILSGHIELASTTLVAGSTERGTLVIDNLTGGPVHLTTGGPVHCKPGWTVVLTSPRLPQEAAFATGCLPQPMDVPVGEMRLPFTLRSDYRTCSATGTAQGPLMPPCVKNANGFDVSPPLPAGDYRATFFSDIGGFIPVESVPVHVVAPG